MRKEQDSRQPEEEARAAYKASGAAMVGDMLDRVIYLDAKTNNLMEWDFPSKDPDQLREGMTLKVKIRGEGQLLLSYCPS